MSMAIGVAQLLKRCVRVYLCGRQVGMSQQFLDGVDFGTIVKKLGGKGVPYYVRASFGECGDSFKVVVYDPINQVGVATLPFVCYNIGVGRTKQAPFGFHGNG